VIEVVNNLLKARVTKTIWLLLFLLILRRRARDTLSFTRQRKKRKRKKISVHASSGENWPVTSFQD